jgi:4-diphosphocytidyl-2-C-methyl-D-erythritol kinase
LFPFTSHPFSSSQVTPDSLRAELIPTDATNLVMRALQLYAERVPEAGAVHCRLHKRIPAQGGLGGGSSDAATALHAANRMAGSPISQETLIQ